MNVEDCNAWDEIFTLRHVELGRWHWNISAFLASSARHSLEVDQLELSQQLYDSVRESNGIEEHWVLQVSAGRLKDPVVVMDWGDEKYTIIDGNHRIVAGFRRGLAELPFIMVTPDIMRHYQIDDFPSH